VKARIHQGDFVYEFFFLLRCLVPTLTEEVTGDQRLLPLPIDQSAAEGEHEDDGESGDMTLSILMSKHLKEVPSLLATKGQDLRLALKNKLKMKNDQAVSEMLKRMGIIKQKNLLQDGSWAYCHYYEPRGTPVWLALK
jgi:hypothetical protein